MLFLDTYSSLSVLLYVVCFCCVYDCSLVYHQRWFFCIILFCIIPTCNANAFDICALNDYLLTYLLTYLNCCDRRTRFVTIWKHFCLILFTGTRILIDCVMRPRSSSRGCSTSNSVTVTESVSGLGCYVCILRVMLSGNSSSRGYDFVRSCESGCQ